MTAETRRFDESLAARPVFRDDGGVARLLGSRCETCDSVAFPRRVVCLECGGAHRAHELTGRGLVHSAAVVGNPPAGFSSGYRYVCVDLDEGARVLGPCVPGEDAIVHGAVVQALVATVRDDELGFRFGGVRDA